MVLAASVLGATKKAINTASAFPSRLRTDLASNHREPSAITIRMRDSAGYVSGAGLSPLVLPFDNKFEVRSPLPETDDWPYYYEKPANQKNDTCYQTLLLSLSR